MKLAFTVQPFRIFLRYGLVESCAKVFTIAVQRRKYSNTIRSTLSAENGNIINILLPSQKHTEELGKYLGATTQAGDVLCLHGDLGAGKTTFARGFIRGARCMVDLDVTSPTYLLDNSYPAETRDGVLASTIPTIHHLDLWRLKDASSRSIVDFHYMFTNEISLIEWPDRLGSLLPSQRLDVRIEYMADNPPRILSSDDPWGFLDENEPSSSSYRMISLLPHGERWRCRMNSLATPSNGHIIQEAIDMNTFQPCNYFTVVLNDDSNDVVS